MVSIGILICLGAGGGDTRSTYVILEYSLNNIYVRKVKSPTWIVQKLF